MTPVAGIKRLSHAEAVNLAAHALLLPALRGKEPGVLFFTALGRALDLCRRRAQ
jgi:hypothetical protein